jgi:hypothetical protein
MDKRTLREQLRISNTLFASRLSVAYEKLKRVSGLSEEAASAIIWPRPYGTRPKQSYFPRFSAVAVTVERARALDAFHDSCQAVAKACRDVETDGLSDLADWIGGWRPADYNTTPEVRLALEAEDPDIALYVWPEGLRLGEMKGHVNVVDLQMIRKIPNEGVVSGSLLRDVQDSASDYAGCRGAKVALHLPPGDEDRWREYLLTKRTGRRAIRIRLCKTSATEGLTFSPSQV